ncbi:MAG: hypothetical protein IH991_00185 [Planctomycetes bacterium]|nr:hypothetical protein [Planctomycetota bacterium]
MNQSLIRDLVQGVNGVMFPPGCCSDFVNHPAGREAVEIATVWDHRFAFYFWLCWQFKDRPSNEKLTSLRDANPPDLLTVDWHNDVGSNSDWQYGLLERLNPQERTELGLYCWLGLHPQNDGQILPAVYLNAIRNVHVILKQHREQRQANPDSYHRPFEDRFGQEHEIHYYWSADEFLERNELAQEYPAIFDLDLDYFTQYDGTDFPTRNSAELVSDDEVRELIHPEGELMEWVLPRLAGMTIALEPEFCGGIPNCLHLLNLVSEMLFDPALFRHNFGWRRPWNG